MNEFETFKEMVEDYWPRCKTTEKQLRVHWEKRVCFHKPGVVSAALSKSLSEFPDDTAPKWKVIFGYLAGRADRDGTGKSKFQILLDGVRRDMKRPYGLDGRVHKGVDNMTDEDIWLNWMRAQTHERELEKRPDTLRCVTCVRTPRGECGLGRGECRVKRIREQEYAYWRNYHEERDEPVPAFLRDGYGEPATFVEPQPSETLF